MPIATSLIPTLNSARQGTLRLENPPIMGIIRQDSPSDLVEWYNTTGGVVLPGEPIIHNGLVCISASLIYPGVVGNVYRKWIADFICTLAADVLVNALVYWDYSGTYGDWTGSGMAVDAAPVNGFILGRAGIGPRVKNLTLNGSGKPISATTASTRIRVNSVPMYPPTTFGAIGTYA
jgi:hypothetical protein